MAPSACETSFDEQHYDSHIRGIPPQAFAELTFAYNAWNGCACDNSLISSGIAERPTLRTKKAGERRTPRIAARNAKIRAFTPRIARPVGAR